MIDLSSNAEGNHYIRFTDQEITFEAELEIFESLNAKIE